MVMRLGLKFALLAAGLSALGDPGSLAAGVGVIVANAERLMSAMEVVMGIFFQALLAVVKGA